MQTRGGTWTAATGFLVGGAVALVALGGWTIPRGSAAPTARVAVVAAPSQILDVGPHGRVIESSRLAPSAAADGLHGSLTVRSATADTTLVHVAAAAADHELDRVLALRLRANGRVVFTGLLQELRGRGSRPFRLPSHASARIAVSAWIPASTTAGYQARLETVTLRFRTRPPATRP